jgi:hypothetical protein
VAGALGTTGGSFEGLRVAGRAGDPLLYTGHDWIDAGLARRSMDLMASEVWPRILAGLAD